jgi:PHD-finger
MHLVLETVSSLHHAEKMQHLSVAKGSISTLDQTMDLQETPPPELSCSLGPRQPIQHAFPPTDLAYDVQSGFHEADHAPVTTSNAASSISHGDPMAVPRNRVVGFPALAPAPAPAPAPRPATETETETETIVSMQLQQQTTAPALISLVPKPSNKPDADTITLRPGSLILSTAPPQQTPAVSPSRKPAATSRKRRNRRKRYHDSDDEIKANNSSSDDDMLPLARQTKSGRQVNRPTFFAPSPEPKQSPRQRPSPSDTPASAKRRRKVYRKNGKDLNITCMHCQRGHSPATNSIVFCDECNSAWHQFCHDPPIGKQLIDVKEAEWFCNECRPGQRITLLKLRLPPRTKPVSTESSLAPLVCGSRFTAEEQRGYLSSLSHASLVDMLITLSKKNPSLPVFPENMKDLHQSKFVITPSTTNAPSISAGISKATETGPDQIMGDAKEDSDSGSEYEVEEHRLYPRPGNGFCLLPEEEDLDILLEDPACSTFSYTLHGYPQANALAENALTIKIAA